MRILVIHEVGYQEKVVYEYQDFAERLASLGHEVHVIDFCERGRGVPKSEKVSRTGVASVDLYHSPCIDLPVLRIATARLMFPAFLRQFLKQKKIDVIWLYSVFVNGTNTLSVARELGIPVVYRVLDVYHKVRQNPLIQLPLLLGEKKIYREADLMSLTNRKMQAYVEGLAGVQLGPRAVIHTHGVDLDFFAPRPPSREFYEMAGLKPGITTILFLGTLYPFSGLDHLLNAFADRTEIKDRFKFVIVGDGEQMNKLREITKRRGLQDQIFFAGRRPYSEVPDWLSIADITVTPFELNDITRDIVPIKILQYLAAGKPLVSAPIPDVISLAPPAESGVIYRDIADPVSFLDAIVALSQDLPRLILLGRKGREHVSSYSVDASIRSVERSLQKVIQAKDRHPYPRN